MHGVLHCLFNIIHAPKGQGRLKIKTNRSLLYFVLALQFARRRPEVFVLPILPVQIMNHFHLLHVLLHFGLLPSALPALHPLFLFHKLLHLVSLLVGTRQCFRFTSIFIFHIQSPLVPLRQTCHMFFDVCQMPMNWRLPE